MRFFFLFQQVWNFFIFHVLFSSLAKHSCQVPPDHGNGESLSPIIILPASSGISYEALHYPIPVEQYQIIPLVINTGKIPLINHAVQAPIQYFIPHNNNNNNNENQRVSNYEPVQYTHPRLSLYHQPPNTQQQHYPNKFSKSQLDDRNRPSYHHHNPPYYPPTTIYSETHVDGQPSSRYSYGYKIIDGDVGHSSIGQNEPINDNNGGDPLSGSYRLAAESDGTSRDRGFEYTEAKYTKQNVNKANDEEDNDELNSTKALKPIIVRPDVKKTQKELKNHYKNTTNLVTPTTNMTNQNGNSTTLKST